MNSEVLAAQGCDAVFKCYKCLKTKERKNHTFYFPHSEKSRMDLLRASLTNPKAW